MMKRFHLALASLGLTAALFLGRATGADAPRERPEGPPPPRQDGGPERNGPDRGGPPGGRPPGVHVIPRFAEEKLNLSEEQRKQIGDLEKEVKDKLAKILSPEQMKTLEESRPPRGPGGPGGGQDGPPNGGGGDDQRRPPRENGERPPGGNNNAGPQRDGPPGGQGDNPNAQRGQRPPRDDNQPQQQRPNRPIN